MICFCQVLLYLDLCVVLEHDNFGENQGIFEATPENKGAHYNWKKSSVENRGKTTSRKVVIKWKNCHREVGKWTSVDLENGWIEDQT
jgi:hypothetical protein